MNWSKLKAALIRAGVVISSIYYGNTWTLVANADVADVSWLKENKPSSLDGLTETVQTEGAGVYRLLIALATLAIIIAIVLTGMALGLGKNGNKRDENKTQFMYIAAGAIAVFGATALVVGFSKIGNSLSF